MALTSRKRSLLALIGLLLLPDHNEARVLSETRVGYGDASSESVSPDRPPTISPPVNQQPVVRPPVTKQPKQNQSFSVTIPVLESKPEVAPKSEVVPEPVVVPKLKGPIREELESGLLRELEQEKERIGEPADVPLTNDDSSEVPETSIMRIIGLGFEDEINASPEIEVTDDNKPSDDTINPAVSNEIDLIGREMSRIMQELSDGEKDPTKRLPIEPVIKAAKEAVQNSPSVLQIDSSLDLYNAQRDEIT